MIDSKTSSPESSPDLNEAIRRIVGIVVRRRWAILSLSCLIPIAVVVVAMKLPDSYVSRATLLVVQQQVSQKYVDSDSTTTIPAAIESLKLEILSESQLVGIINDLNLYPGVKARAPEALVDRMRKEIEIEPLETSPGRVDFSAFTIAFTASNPRLAQQVTSRLTSLFIEQNLRSRGEQAANTTKFLSDQLAAAKQRLETQEQRLQAFKTANLGELPEDQSVNLQAMADVRERLEVVAARLSQIQQQQVTLELSLSEYLTRLQSERTALLSHYTPRYPEVVEKDRQIGKVQAALDDLKKGVPSSGSQSTTDPGDNPAVEAILKQAESSAAEMATLSKQQQKLTAEAEQYRKQLNLVPLREQQVAEIVRDYNLYKEDYDNLLNKKLQSDMTASLEENQEGQHFRLVDPPTLPLKPSGPKRLKISLGGLAGGVAASLALAILLDLLDGSFHGEAEVSKLLSLPFVIGLPLVRTPRESRRRTLRIVFECVVGVLMVIAMFSTEFYVFKNG